MCPSETWNIQTEVVLSVNCEAVIVYLGDSLDNSLQFIKCGLISDRPLHTCIINFVCELTLTVAEGKGGR